MPTVYRDKDSEQTPFQTDPRGVLQRFLMLFGFALDGIRTEYETLKHLNDPTQVAGGLLPVMAKQWGSGSRPSWACVYRACSSATPSTSTS